MKCDSIIGERSSCTSTGCHQDSGLYGGGGGEGGGGGAGGEGGAAAAPRGVTRLAGLSCGALISAVFLCKVMWSVVSINLYSCPYHQWWHMATQGY